MSYILEALRRAESERERKRGVPGLHAQPVPAPASEESGERRAKPWRWIVLGVAAGVLLPLAWRLWSGDPAPEDTTLPRAPVAGNVTGQANAGAAPATPAPAPMETASAVAVAPTDGGNTTAPAASAPAPGVAAKPPPKASPKHPSAAKTADAAHAAAPAGPAPTSDGAAARSRTSAPAPAPANAPPPIAARPDANALPAPAPAPAAAPEPRLRTLAELPEDMRRSVPALAFGGSVYSDIAAQRMVIFNGQVLREGDPLSDELMLEQIRPRSAVLRMRGQRFEVPF